MHSLGLFHFFCTTLMVEIWCGYFLDYVIIRRSAAAKDTGLIRALSLRCACAILVRRNCDARYSRRFGAQADINQVHVLPRTLATPPGPTQHVLRSNVDLVLVNVTVLDRANRAVTGLGPTNRELPLADRTGEKPSLSVDGSAQSNAKPEESERNVDRGGLAFGMLLFCTDRLIV